MVPPPLVVVESEALAMMIAPTIIAITVTTIVHTEMLVCVRRLATHEEHGQSVSEESQLYCFAVR